MLKRIRAFRRDESGMATLDAILWIPFFLIITITVLDVSMVFMNYARVQKFLNDGERAFAVGMVSNCEQMQVMVDGLIQPIAPGAKTQCQPEGYFTTSWVDVQARDLDLSGATSLVPNFTLRVRSVHTTEHGIHL